MKRLILALLIIVASTGIAHANEYEDVAKEKLSEIRKEQIALFYAKKLNKIENLKAQIVRIEREISEIVPEEIEVEIPKEQEATTYFFNTGSSSLVLGG